MTKFAKVNKTINHNKRKDQQQSMLATGVRKSKLQSSLNLEHQTTSKLNKSKLSCYADDPFE